MDGLKQYNQNQLDLLTEDENDFVDFSSWSWLEELFIRTCTQ